MNYGGGNIWNIQNQIPSGAPFLAGSANNGLSVDPVTGQIVLGQDIGAVGNPARLLSNREIPLNGRSFALGQILTDLSFLIDPPANDWLIGNRTLLSNILIADESFTGNALHFIDRLAGFPTFTVGAIATGTPSILNSADSVSGLELSQAPSAGLARLFGTQVEVTTGPLALRLTGSTTLLRTGQALLNGAGAAAGTLTNAPAAGDPTKWIRIDDNGTIRHIPAW